MTEVNKTRLEKLLNILKIIILCILILVGVFYYGIRIVFKTPVTSYYNASEKAFEIPGLNDNFVPQGFCYDEVETQYLISGYDSAGGASSVYIVNDEKDKENIATKRVRLSKSNGEKFTGHVGGIAINGEYVYIANGERIYVFSYSNIKNAKNNEKVKYINYKELKSENDALRASFVHTYNGKLYVGEFHDGGQYKARSEHNVTTKAGDSKNALMLEYDLNTEDCQYGIAKDPTRVFAIPDKIQGVCLDGDTIYCSASYGFTFSQIYKFDLTQSVNEGEKTVLGQVIPLYSLDKVSHIKTYETAPMAEGIVYKNKKLYIMSEFACNKYIMGKFLDAKYCYATDLSKM